MDVVFSKNLIKIAMELLPKDIILEFNPNTLEDVRKEFNLDKPERIEEAVDILDDWVKKQTHFKKKDFSREYLERTIISCKGLVERAKIRMDKLCTYKTLMPEFFKNADSEAEFALLNTQIIQAHLPKMTPDNYRAYMAKVIKADDFDKAFMFTYYKYITLTSEYMKSYEYTKGYILILDYSETNLMSLVSQINLVELRQALTLLMDGYGMRLKAMHIITPSKAVTAMISILKQVLSEKLSNRVHTHKSIETVYDHVPMNILPEEYGGDAPSLKKLNEDWLKVYNSKEFLDYLREMNEASTIESSRQTDKFAEQCVGMPGSFRSLCVD